MNGRRLVRALKLIAAGAVLLQASGCTTVEFFTFIQTVLLGITAAGSIAIIQNI